MCFGLPVPQVYIVPAERFCREMGPALGVNLAEFEFPAYFNFFVYKKRCTLVVDSQDAQDNICRVFSETLLGPGQFRGEDAIAFEEEDFAPDFPREAIPNFEKEFKHFRIMPDGKELVLETLLDFCQFKQPGVGCSHDNLGVPPMESGEDDKEENIEALGDNVEKVEVPKDLKDVESRGTPGKKARWVGEYYIEALFVLFCLVLYAYTWCIPLSVQATLQRYGQRIRRKRRRMPAPPHVWRYSKCPVGRNILSMTLT
jgi:hypothetical protein